MHSMKKWFVTFAALLLAAVVLAGCAAPAATQTTAPATQPSTQAQSSIVLNGAGATFPAPLYTKWFDEYNKLTGVKINYQAIGSGGGINQITAGTVDFGASDGIMTDNQTATAEAAHGPYPAHTHDQRRCRPGIQSYRNKLGTIEADRRCAGQHLPQKNYQMERPGYRGT